MMCPKCKTELIGYDQHYRPNYKCPMCGHLIKNTRDIPSVWARKQPEVK